MSSVLSVRREALRVAGESREAYGDLLAEVLAEAAGPEDGETLQAPSREAAKRPTRAEQAQREPEAMPLA